MDVYISGESKLMAWHLAQEYGINAILAGHYATEVFGVKAVGNLLATRFKVAVEFIDMQILTIPSVPLTHSHTPTHSSNS